MNNITKVSITKIINKKNGILHSDGLLVAKELINSFKGEPLQISFEGLNHITTAFLHASIGNFLQEVGNGNPKELINTKLISFVGLEKKSKIQIQLKRVIARVEHPDLAKIEDEILEEYHFN